MGALYSYVRLMRPATMITSLADVFLGFAIAGMVVDFYKMETYFKNYEISSILHIVFVSAGLFAGGVVLNDYFDFENDKKNNPHRPLVAEKLSIHGVLLLAIVLNVGSVAYAFFNSLLTGCIALLISLLSLLFNKHAKKTEWGIFNWAGCRAGNTMLGMSVLSSSIYSYWYILGIHFIYLLSISILVKSNENNNNKKSSETGFLLYLFLLVGFLHLGLHPKFNFTYSSPFLLLFVLYTLPWFLKTLKNPETTIFNRNKNNFSGLVLLEAALTAGFADILTGLMLLALLPLSIYVKRIFPQ